MEHDGASAFTNKVQKLLLQQEFIQTIKAKDVAKVKAILCNPELDINYEHTFTGSNVKVIKIIKLFNIYL